MNAVVIRLVVAFLAFSWGASTEAYSANSEAPKSTSRYGTFTFYRDPYGRPIKPADPGETPAALGQRPPVLDAHLLCEDTSGKLNLLTDVKSLFNYTYPYLNKGRYESKESFKKKKDVVYEAVTSELASTQGIPYVKFSRILSEKDFDYDADKQIFRISKLLSLFSAVKLKSYYDNSSYVRKYTMTDGLGLVKDRRMSTHLGLSNIVNHVSGEEYDVTFEKIWKNDEVKIFLDRNYVSKYRGNFEIIMIGDMRAPYAGEDHEYSETWSTEREISHYFVNVDLACAAVRNNFDGKIIYVIR